MMMEMLIIFIVITIILLILSVFVMDDNPILSIPFIFAGMVFTILCSYGFFDVGTFYMGQNLTTGNLEPLVYSDPSYGEMYPWVFFFIFILYIILFIRVGFNLIQEAKETQGQIDYHGNRRR
jgi:hypothetical protein